MHARELSWFIIRRCYRNRKPITHLRLQSLLYKLYVENIKNNNKSLFNEKFHILFYMPIIKNIFYEFNIYSSVDIIPTKYDPDPQIILEDNLLNIIDKFCDKKPWEYKLTDDKWDIIKQFQGKDIDETLIKKIYKN